MDKIKILLAVALGFFIYKKVAAKPAGPKRSGAIIPSNLPTGVKLVYSMADTIVYDRAFMPIYEYETKNYGMAVTGEPYRDMYDVVIGNDFLNGIPGRVFKVNVTEKPS